MKQTSVLVIVPAFNEELNISQVLGKLHQFSFCEELRIEILAIDDASTDSTLKKIVGAGVNYVALPMNFGITQVFQFANRIALDLGFDFMLIVDGDGQHPISEIYKLMSFRDLNSIVIGTRNFNVYPISKTRFIAIKFLRMILNRKFGILVNDPTSGFRLIPKAAFEVIQNLRHHTNFLEDTVLVLPVLARHGVQIREVEVEMVVRPHGVSSSRGLKNVTNFISCVLQLLAQKRKNS